MSDYETIDYFTDQSLVDDPYPYFDYLRDGCPVRRLPHHNTIAVTGYEEGITIYNDADHFSSASTVGGPFPPLPFEPEGDDITEQIEANREYWMMGGHLVTLDPPEHTRQRALLMRLITPKRLKENEDFMHRLADRQMDEFFENGRCEFLSEYARPFALLTVADLLGVPEEDFDLLRAKLGARKPGAMEKEASKGYSTDPLEFLQELFTEYVVDRRSHPRHDVLTGLATATFPDGSIPPPADVARTASFLFAAGQDTTGVLMTSALRILCERPELQRRLRDDPKRVANFVEETLRFESPVKTDFRLVRRTCPVGGVETPAGTTIALMNGAMNRDPRRFENPNEFDPDRANAKHHIAFGHGAHTCPGTPLARAEARISVERLLARMSDIRIDESVHGPAGQRDFGYMPTYILRALNNLNIEFTPAP